jgi:orotidine-5'-phosphate decarboxylase
MIFSDRLRVVQARKDSLLCVGLDIDPQKIPSYLRRSRTGVFDFISGIVEATYDLVCAYKPNLAFFEAMGSEGWDLLRRTVSLIPRNIITIGDGKRGDIGNTGERYATALFDDLKFDSVTVSPYMGRDSVEPFLTRPDKGVFLLALTSNAGSADFQRAKVAGRPLYERVVRVSQQWGYGPSTSLRPRSSTSLRPRPSASLKPNLGYVVGATHPAELKRVRKLAPKAPLLIPGVGSQGGDLEAAVRAGVTKFGDLAVINASRSILYASSGRDFARAARAEAKRLRTAMERVREAL